MLSGVNVALGVTGSIAAVKVVELAHELRRQGANVRAVMSHSATSIIHPWAVEFATEHDVVTEITGRVEHVELCGRDGWADVFLIAPATANSVGKIAAAIDDTPVTTTATTALGADIPVVIAPAMHEPMYDHPGVLDAIDRVESWGVSFVDPRIEEGKAKIATEEAIVTDVARATTPQTLSDTHVVVTSGATSESIDPIRLLTNRASGTTGREVARACYCRGADVTLVHDGPDVPYATVKQVESGQEMLIATQTASTDADVLISAAAISDFTVETARSKIRSGEPMTLKLTPTPKLIDTIREQQPTLPIVGFKAETTGDDDAMIEQARSLLDRVSLQFVVANDASVMGEHETRVLLVSSDDIVEQTGSKQTVAGQIASTLAINLSDSDTASK
ncbi:bifunctional phosphopantothenoylcysteine decarboxylase/phosphopantothenate--cysteine ligase CoaBC [Natronocalculus amylovorans]|uniref:Coenzyme A biosynthesis bifunctional protein CoaBC n=1 Tax=Natronocalculus amylovorans TaxID=2917812 RepID=A0AAE3G0U6_9EURY|nr:bifunctional phosphopantothenoylcysteine decarboxylase/phosphopantothenate--cysteine ligase CoaBC [Natronocalculus amylovorans]MCL9818418.1 bifunctional phosphopantothenoylcysteine decarboxylase/phosphopantothenate--cysteine ligase CoaBC [Natronocalculus amylovorans]NUE02510.1 bifunctional phosphopantothenoylcysteine decarboxylase/phosphopantothenate--cysteine ligase CoaBC [Halorubraceae archaeon YAN]